MKILLAAVSVLAFLVGVLALLITVFAIADAVVKWLTRDHRRVFKKWETE